MKKKTTSQLVRDLVFSVSSSSTAKRTFKTIYDSADELVKRGVLTEEDAKFITTTL